MNRLQFKFIVSRLYWHIKHTNILKTIYINFRLLPLKTALKMPIHIMGKVDLSINKQGCLQFKQTKIKPFTIHIGDCNLNFCHKNTMTTIRIWGVMEIGEGVDIQRGANITVTPTGRLFLDEKVQICSNTKIVCAKSVAIGKMSQISHESQIFDTNFHAVQDLVTKEVSISAPIAIGAYCWVGNRTTINMGTILSSNTIVASNSLLNKDYSPLGEQIVLGGIPAKLLTGNRERVWDTNMANQIINQKIVLV